MSINCPDECFKIDMGCDCPPPPPDKPLPFLFIIYNTDAIDYGTMFAVNSTNPGKVGIVNNVTPSIPSYTSLTLTTTNNFSTALPITIPPPPGFPGAGLVQATATMTVDALGYPTITMTNVGAGYTTPSSGNSYLSHTFGNYFTTINVKTATATVLDGVGQPTGRLSLPVPFGANLPVSSAKILPHITGYITNTLAGGSPITITCKWYKSGVQIGQTLQKVIATEGKHPITHYCTGTTFSNTDTLSYKITSADDELVNFEGVIDYFVQYI